MSPLTPGLGPEDWRLDQTVAEQQAIEKVLKERTLLDQAEGHGSVSRGRRVADRFRRILARGSPPARSAEADVSEGQAWERERERRSEYEHDRQDSGG